MLANIAAIATAILASFVVADNDQEIHAIATISGPNNVTGNVYFSQCSGDDSVFVNGTISGLTPNVEHGFHVHAFGDISGGCNSTGAHFNPYNATHGAKDAEVRHVGDLGNVMADANGVATFTMEDNIISLYGPRGIIGRGVVVHVGRDDLGLGGTPDSLTTGNAGARAGCGVIGIHM